MKPFFFTIIFFLFTTVNANSQTRLKPGDSVRTNINHTETKSYIIKAKKGDQVEFEVIQDGIDVTITISFLASVGLIRKSN
jgi:hypothetical protein